MHRPKNRPRRSWVSTAVLVILACGSIGAAQAAIHSFSASLSGANEATPNNSPGTGTAQVVIDDVAHTMHVVASFQGLEGTTTASHIHAPTAVAGTPPANVATQTPSFSGFPLGVTAGTYDQTFDLTQASSYNAAFITANGGSAATAEAALLQYLTQGRAYFNIHSSVYGGGEISGFLTGGLVPIEVTTWGQTKALYR